MINMNMTINRLYQDDCTIGVLTVQGLTGDAFRFFTLELPDLDNQINISCIPEGDYYVNKCDSHKLGECFNIQAVDGRSFIRIHSGNYTSQIQGCILVGSSLSDINGDGVIDVGNSRSALSKLLEYMPDEFQLTIL